jgi:SEC-C motif
MVPVLQDVFGEREVRQVAENTACFDLDRVKDALANCQGNVDDAVEHLILQMGALSSECDTASAQQSARASDTAIAEQQPRGVASENCTGSYVTVVLIGKRRRVKLSLVVGTQVEGKANLAGGMQNSFASGHAGSACDTAPSRVVEAQAGKNASGSQQPAARDTSGGKSARIRHNGERPPANSKPCPCGSGLKYKACCKMKSKIVADSQKQQRSAPVSHVHTILI